MSDDALVLRYQSITGPRDVQIVPVKQMGRVRYQVLANDVRLEFAGSFFDTPRKAMEEVQRAIHRKYGSEQRLDWLFCGAGAERSISVDQVGDAWPA